MESSAKAPCKPYRRQRQMCIRDSLNDVNMIDPFHLEAYGKTTVNYNRDIEIYPVLMAIFEGIFGECPYKSPTDMGVNMAGNCIIDKQASRKLSEDTIIHFADSPRVNVKLMKFISLNLSCNRQRQALTTEESYPPHF